MDHTLDQVLVRTILEHAADYPWRLQGIGLLALRLDGCREFRLHVWDPEACVGDPPVHDHPYDFTSTIVVGDMINTPLRRRPSGRRVLPGALLAGRREPATDRCGPPDRRVDQLRPWRPVPAGRGRAAQQPTDPWNGDRHPVPMARPARADRVPPARRSLGVRSGPPGRPRRDQAHHRRRARPVRRRSSVRLDERWCLRRTISMSSCPQGGCAFGAGVAAGSPLTMGLPGLHRQRRELRLPR